MGVRSFKQGRQVVGLMAAKRLISGEAGKAGATGLSCCFAEVGRCPDRLLHVCRELQFGQFGAVQLSLVRSVVEIGLSKWRG